MQVNLTNVVKRYNGIAVLDDVTLSVSGGEVVALTGESGSGKSTLLHIAAGLETPDSGGVELNGQDLSVLSDRERSNLRLKCVGLVFQQFNLIPSLTVAQNLVFQARLSGRDFRSVKEIAEPLGLAAHLEKYPEQLSGGQQQRVAIGRAIASAPDFLFADEPTGSLDETTGEGVFDLLIHSAKSTNAGLLVVTHSERLAEKADRRVHLKGGHLLS